MKYAILMGDVIKSMASDHVNTYRALQNLIAKSNAEQQDNILSPLTITLGDEFQGVARNFETALRMIFWIDEKSRISERRLNIRYSAVYGEISTPINSERAHEMIGEGLQQARQLISVKKRSRDRFQIKTGATDLDHRLEKLFTIAEGIVDRWPTKDFDLIDSLIKQENDQVVGEQYHKTRQQIYKRRRTLMVAEYNALKELIFTAGRELDERVFDV